MAPHVPLTTRRRAAGDNVLASQLVCVDGNSNRVVQHDAGKMISDPKLGFLLGSEHCRKTVISELGIALYALPLLPPGSDSSKM